MPADHQFDVVMLRAVDHMEAAIREAISRARLRVLILTTSNSTLPDFPETKFQRIEQIPLPKSEIGTLEILVAR